MEQTRDIINEKGEISREECKLNLTQFSLHSLLLEFFDDIDNVAELFWNPSIFQNSSEK